MGRDDWYRRTTWTTADRAAFHERLGRSRGAATKAQSARIQACYLEDAGLYEPALELLGLVLNEFPEWSQLANAHLQVGRCRLAMKQVPEALDAYRAALRAERDSPTFLSDVWIAFPWFVVTNRMTELYTEAREFLAWRGEFGHDCEFPLDRYRRCAVEALIADEEGHQEAARAYARHALEAAQAQHSGMAYHPTLGLVGQQDPVIGRRLEELSQ